LGYECSIWRRRTLDAVYAGFCRSADVPRFMYMYYEGHSHITWLLFRGTCTWMCFREWRGVAAWVVRMTYRLHVEVEWRGSRTRCYYLVYCFGHHRKHEAWSTTNVDGSRVYRVCCTSTCTCTCELACASDEPLGRSTRDDLFLADVLDRFRRNRLRLVSPSGRKSG